MSKAFEINTFQQSLVQNGISPTWARERLCYLYVCAYVRILSAKVACVEAEVPVRAARVHDNRGLSRSGLGACEFQRGSAYSSKYSRENGSFFFLLTFFLFCFTRESALEYEVFVYFFLFLFCMAAKREKAGGSFTYLMRRYLDLWERFSRPTRLSECDIGT